MSAPKTSAAYPAAMLELLARAEVEENVVIPTDNPLALRLRFQGLRGALRREKHPLADVAQFLIQKTPPAVVLRSIENSQHARDLRAALALRPQAPSNVPNGPNPQNAIDEAEAALNRILGGL